MCGECERTERGVVESQNDGDRLQLARQDTARSRGTDACRHQDLGAYFGTQGRTDIIMTRPNAVRPGSVDWVGLCNEGQEALLLAGLGGPRPLQPHHPRRDMKPTMSRRGNGGIRPLQPSEVPGAGKELIAAAPEHLGFSFLWLLASPLLPIRFHLFRFILDLECTAK